MSSSDSDSSEDIEALREAVDSTLAANFAPKDLPAEKPVEPTRVASNRGRLERKPLFFEKNHLSEEVKGHIAKKLDEIIDSRIKLSKKKKGGSTVEPDESDTAGVQLFSSSKTLIDLVESDKGSKPRRSVRPGRKRRSGNCSASSSDDDEKLASVAVDADWVLRKKGAYLGNPREADFLVLENGDCREAGANGNGSVSSDVIEPAAANGHHRSACRKKKKRDSEKRSGREDYDLHSPATKPKKNKRKKRELHPPIV